MSCHGCADSFGFLKKEYGCPQCGFSFCKKCLRFKIKDAKLGKISACQGCYSKTVDSANVLGENKLEKSANILEAFHKLQSLENPDRPPIVLYREGSNSRLGRLKKGLSVEDQKIVERLESLRQTNINSTHKRKSENPEEEVALRLAQLRGEDYPKSSSQNVLQARPPETDSELISRLTAEVTLDEKHNTSMVADIEERLARLRQTRFDNKDPVLHGESSANRQMEVDHSSSLENITEEEQIKRIMEQYTKEVEIESKLTPAIDGGLSALGEHEGNSETVEMESNDDDVDVDLLCRICDEKRATLMCKECDNDIFCKNCFLEFHKEIGEMHKPKSV